MSDKKKNQKPSTKNNKPTSKKKGKPSGKKKKAETKNKKKTKKSGNENASSKTMAKKTALQQRQDRRHQGAFRNAPKIEKGIKGKVRKFDLQKLKSWMESFGPKDIIEFLKDNGDRTITLLNENYPLKYLAGNHPLTDPRFPEDLFLTVRDEEKLQEMNAERSRILEHANGWRGRVSTGYHLGSYEDPMMFGVTESGARIDKLSIDGLIRLFNALGIGIVGAATHAAFRPAYHWLTGRTDKEGNAIHSVLEPKWVKTNLLVSTRTDPSSTPDWLQELQKEVRPLREGDFPHLRDAMGCTSFGPWLVHIIFNIDPLKGQEKVVLCIEARPKPEAPTVHGDLADLLSKKDRERQERKSELDWPSGPRQVDKKQMFGCPHCGALNKYGTHVCRKCFGYLDKSILCPFCDIQIEPWRPVCPRCKEIIDKAYRYDSIPMPVPSEQIEPVTIESVLLSQKEELYCGECEGDLLDDADFCPRCGLGIDGEETEEQEQRRQLILKVLAGLELDYLDSETEFECPDCGKMHPGDALFCPLCGECPHVDEEDVAEVKADADVEDDVDGDKDSSLSLGNVLQEALGEGSVDEAEESETEQKPEKEGEDDAQADSEPEEEGKSCIPEINCPICDSKIRPKNGSCPDCGQALKCCSGCNKINAATAEVCECGEQFKVDIRDVIVEALAVAGDQVPKPDPIQPTCPACGKGVSPGEVYHSSTCYHCQADLKVCDGCFTVIKAETETCECGKTFEAEEKKEKKNGKKVEEPEVEVETNGNGKGKDSRGRRAARNAKLEQ